MVIELHLTYTGKSEIIFVIISMIGGDGSDGL